MKCDVEGNVYCTGPGGIYVHDTAGKVLVRIRTPGHHPPTNFAWGDDDWRSLYITNIGSVVRTRLNIPGVPGRWEKTNETADYEYADFSSVVGGRSAIGGYIFFFTYKIGSDMTWNFELVAGPTRDEPAVWRGTEAACCSAR